VSGAATLRVRGLDDIPISVGDSVLMPACIGEYEIAPADRCEILRIFVPDVEEEIVRALASKGVDKEAIDAIVF